MIYRIRSPFGCDILEADFQNHKLVLGVPSQTHLPNCWIESEYDEIVPLELAQEGRLHPGCWQQIYTIPDLTWDFIAVRVHWYDGDELWVDFVTSSCCIPF